MLGNEAASSLGYCEIDGSSPRAAHVSLLLLVTVRKVTSALVREPWVCMFRSLHGYLCA